MPLKISLKHCLKLTDKAIFEQYLSIKTHELSPYNFANIYIWKDLFEIFWYLIDDSLCVFFNNPGGCFMYVSPLGININEDIINQCFKIMDEYNSNAQMSRIENVLEQEASIYKNMGFPLKEKSGDYLYLRTKLAELKGNAYKSKRADYNFFVNNYKYEYRQYRKSDEINCISLLENWVSNHKQSNKGQVYNYMLEDILPVQQSAIKNYSELDLVGRVVEVEGGIAGYTFGYELNPNTFCIMFEVVNKHYKGLSQFIFREICREIEKYEYINAMDDSGLENLAKVKRSYSPYKIVTNSIVVHKP